MRYPIDALGGRFVADTIFENITQSIQIGLGIYRFGKAIENGYYEDEGEYDKDDDYYDDDY